MKGGSFTLILSMSVKADTSSDGPPQAGHATGTDNLSFSGCHTASNVYSDIKLPEKWEEKLDSTDLR